MTITLTKTRLALAILVAALLAPASAYAAQVFDDVADGRFFSDAVAWAYDNDITTGRSATTFAPDDSVTRGESVTFLQRYHENVAQPGRDELQAQIDANAAAIEANEMANTTNADAAEMNAAAIAAVEDRPVTHWAAVAPDGTLIGTSYPGATAGTDDELGEDVFVVEFPGLEWIGDEEFACGVQTTGVGFEDIVFTSLVFSPEFEERRDAIWAIALHGFDGGAEDTPAFVMVTITC